MAALIAGSKDWSKTWTFFENDWHEGNIGIYGPRTHAAWLASSGSTVLAPSRA
jgi:branched-chain amino acid aminotransferase